MDDNGKNEIDALVNLNLWTRNARLTEARYIKGVNQLKMAKAVGISVMKLSGIENLKVIPTLEIQIRIAEYFGKEIDYLFPPILVKAIECGVFEHRKAQLAEPEILRLSEIKMLSYNGEKKLLEDIAQKELKNSISEVLNTLNPREKAVLEERFGLIDGEPKILEEVGRMFGVTRQRIRQIEAKALRKLRHPSRARQLKDFL